MAAPTRSRGYGVGLAALILATIVLASFSLTVIFGGQAAFPVSVFGRAVVAEGETPLAIRGETAGQVAQGFLEGFELPPEHTGAFGSGAFGSGAPWVDADPQLTRARELAGVGRYQEALAVFERLARERPGSEEVAIERARVLSWSGQPLEAAAAIRRIADRRRSDAALRLEAARYYWFGGDVEAADELLSEARRLGADQAEVAELASQVRAAMTPDARAARRWLSENDSWQNRLHLARAYLADERWLEAVDEFERALAAGPAPDSVYLQIAAAATAADSTRLAIEAIGEYVRLHPEDADARLSLARAYSWAEQYDLAIPEYRRYLEFREDPPVRFELAQTLSWMERNVEAARELRRVALAQPLHAPTYRLLGDLARWGGDHELAIANYRYASDLAPADAAVRTALRETEAEYARIRMAAMPLPLSACTIAFDSFTDSEGFSWMETRGSRTWRSDWGAVQVQAHQAISHAEHAFATGDRRLGGLGASVALFLPISETASIDLLAGTTDYGEFGTYVRGGLGIEMRELGGATVAARYTRQPALQRAATIASLQAGTTSDRVEVTASRPFGAWSAWSSLEAERLASDYGQTYRYGANLSLSRPVTSRVTLTAGLSAIAASGDAPRLPDGRPLYWTPEVYVAPTVGATYRQPIGEHWSVAARVTPGWAYVRERETGERRFGKTHFPTLGAGLEVGYTAGDWNLLGIADWGGSVDATGYRATTLGIQGSYRLGQP